MRFGWEGLWEASFGTISKDSLGLWFFWLFFEHWVLSLPLYVLGSISQSRLHDTTCFLLPSFCQSLTLLGMRSKSTSLSPGFCVRRPRQSDTICWEFNLISGFFAFFWLIVWSDGINKCGCVLQEAEDAYSMDCTRSQV